MQVQSNDEKEIIKLCSQLNELQQTTFDIEQCKRLENSIENRLMRIVYDHFSDKLSTEFVEYVKKNISIESITSRTCWKLFRMMNAYLHANNEKEKNSLFYELVVLLNRTDREYILADINFTKAIYLSNVPEIVNLFKKYFPKPPLSVFDGNNIPQNLVKEAEEKKSLVTEFKQRNAQDNFLENKVMYLQRHIRAKNRRDSEIKRIQKMYFADQKLEFCEALEKTSAVIDDANAPYKPQKCTPELADRIMKAADKVTLHSTVKHLTAIKNVGTILNECLYGRENLINTFTSFRPAALSNCDKKDGDGNVICFGPDKIDQQCLKSRTITLEFELNKLLDPAGFNKNPGIFFKQEDFGYGLDLKQNVKLKSEFFGVNHTGTLRGIVPGWSIESAIKCISLVLYSESGRIYYSELPKYSFISYNTKDIHKIWALNFFRFLDTLQDSIHNYKANANDQIKHIYDLITEMTDEELVAFLTDLGRKMSCTAEFNFYGAYKIDLNALLNITLHDNGDFRVSMKELINEINAGSFESLLKIKELAPELIKSTRFVDFIASKIADPIISSRFKDLV